MNGNLPAKLIFGQFTRITMRRRMETPYEEKARREYGDILVGLLFLVVFIAAGLAFVVHFRPLYFSNIKWLKLEEITGISSVVIKSDYNALIDYLNPFSNGELVFPALSSSVNGLAHFADVKLIFRIVYIAGAVSLLTLAVVIFFKVKKGKYGYLRTSSIITASIPLIFTSCIAVDFSSVFDFIHRALFGNDNWLLNPIADPIVELLPETYFLECNIIIIAGCLIGSLVLYLIFRRKRSRLNTKSLMPKKMNYYY